MSEVRHLFSTPVWMYDFSDDLGLLKCLHMDSLAYGRACNEAGKCVDFFGIDGYGAQDLLARIKVATAEILEYQGVAGDVVDVQWTGRQQIVQPLERDTPHDHPGCEMTFIYYLKVPPKSGDLLLMETRGQVRGMWRDRYVNHSEDGKTARTFVRIAPKEGLLLCIPHYLMHSVETNLSNEQRTSIISNVHIRTRYDH